MRASVEAPLVFFYLTFRSASGRPSQLTHLQLPPSVFKANFVHQRAQQEDSAAVFVGNMFHRGWIGERCEIKTGTRIANCYGNRGIIAFDVAMHDLRGIILATVDDRVGESFLDRHEKVVILRGVMAALANKGEHLVAGLGYLVDNAAQLEMFLHAEPAVADCEAT
jgi:hypothetical protein